MGVLTVSADAAAKIILASASAARTRLMAGAGVAHTCCPADVDEDLVKRNWTGKAEGLALELAKAKALHVSAKNPDTYVVGADQVLAFEGDVFDKPGTTQGVRDHLQKLRGHTHTLISAVAVARDGYILWSTADSANLSMRAFSDAFLETHIAAEGEDVAHSVGAYHLEGLGAQLFDQIEGDYFTVLGLPLIPLLNFLRSQGALDT